MTCKMYLPSYKLLTSVPDTYLKRNHFIGLSWCCNSRTWLCFVVIATEQWDWVGRLQSHIIQAWLWNATQTLRHDCLDQPFPNFGMLQTNLKPSKSLGPTKRSYIHNMSIIKHPFSLLLPNYNDLSVPSVPGSAKWQSKIDKPPLFAYLIRYLNGQLCFVF